MGYNTTVLILNDAADLIEKDPEFGHRLNQAILMVGESHRAIERDGQQTVPILNHCNGCTVVEKHHADQTALVAVGGNYATTVHRAWGYKHHEEEDKIRLLRSWAGELGFRLVKKK